MARRAFSPFGQPGGYPRRGGLWAEGLGLLNQEQKQTQAVVTGKFTAVAGASDGQFGQVNCYVKCFFIIEGELSPSTVLIPAHGEPAFGDGKPTTGFEAIFIRGQAQDLFSGPADGLVV